MGKTIAINVKVKNYTGKVLGVVKEKFGLKDKGEALDRLAEMFGEEFVEKEVNEETIREIIESCERHIKKYGFRSRTTGDLRKKIEAE